MRIRSLEITGFKSFGERAVLVLDRGISAIVGPNGCGKSNVVDAIRWVMGEQNPRHLRGRSMEDVIFAGTESQLPVGLAEVVLNLDNSDGLAPEPYAGFTDIQVARRLYRSGESEYLINKTAVRLRDVTDLFLDTGVGTRGYTIVEQGKIAEIISTRPEERRIIFEEAAGIGKYRQRRRETERKLQATEQNLVRVTDILGELRRQINSLDRQARRANRYKQLQAQVRDLELTVTWEELQADRARVERAERELEEARAAGVALDARVARAESGLESERRAHLDRERELQRDSERLYELRSEIQSLESRIQFERRERDGLLRLVEERRLEIEELEEQLQTHSGALQDAVREFAELDERLAADAADLEARERQLREQAERQAQLEGKREGLQARLIRLLGEAATLESRCEAIDERRNEIELRLRETEQELEASGGEIEEIRREEQRLEARLREALADQDQLGRGLAELLRSGEIASARLEAQRDELASLLPGVQQISARLDALREADRRESSRVTEALGALPEGERVRVRGLLSEVLRIEEGLEAALGAVLGGCLDAVLVEDPRTALEFLGALRREKAGRATVLPLTSGAPALEPGFVPLGRRLLEFVSVDAPHRPLVERLLGDVYLVDDLREAVERFGAADPPAVFVTREGEVLDRRGALTGGSDAPRGTLRRAAEIRRLAGQLEASTARVRELEAAEAAEAQRGAECAREIENLRSRRHTAELAVVNLEKDLERARERAKLGLEHAEALRSAKGDLLAEIGRRSEECTAARGRLAELAGERGEAESAREQLGSGIATLAREVERLEQRVVRARVETAELGARRDQLRDGRDRLQTRVDEAREWLKRRGEEVSRARERSESLLRSAAEAEEQLAEQIRREEGLRAGREAERARYEESARRVEELEAEVRAAAREREATRERTTSAELGAQEVRMRRDQLQARVLERYGVDLAHYEPPEAQRRGDPEAREAELKRLRASLESLGDVHLGAIEEYEEVSERHRYLSEQKADLELSIERLRNAIARINRTSRARFRETFAKIDEQFRHIYPRMFAGGRAHLSLTDADDVLEAGIEITAQPPGKKLQNVNLLSGGEKALTALALLFAVFTFKPSPFFLLDEVDAALDDANVGRFDELLRELASDSQFLIITHNKASIESADTLYGVTMEEPGLSKLVTVDLVS